MFEDAGGGWGGLGGRGSVGATGFKISVKPSDLVSMIMDQGVVEATQEYKIGDIGAAADKPRHDVVSVHVSIGAAGKAALPVIPGAQRAELPGRDRAAASTE